MRRRLFRQYEAALAHQPHARRDDLWIVQSPCAAHDLLERSVHAGGRAIWPRRAHRLDSVRHGQNARLQENLLALQTSRITAAVPALVRLVDDVGDRPAEIDV